MTVPHAALLLVVMALAGSNLVAMITLRNRSRRLELLEKAI